MYNYYLPPMSALYMDVKFLSRANNNTLKNTSSLKRDICFPDQIYLTNPIALSGGQLDD